MNENAQHKKTDVALPDLGEVNETIIVEWLKKLGDTVSEGEDLVEVETEKTTFLVPAPLAGRLGRIHLQAGERARVGDVLGEIERV